MNKSVIYPILYKVCKSDASLISGSIKRMNKSVIYPIL